MLIRKLRHEKGMSQEELAEAAHLSLRTIQRVEAGHRVSYASLRSLAATFDINVDLLERELYAMTTSKDEYLEKPLWVRLILNLPVLRHQGSDGLIKHEIFLVGYALFAYVSSFIVLRVETPYWGITTVDLLYFSAFSALFVAYFAAVTQRLRIKAKIGASTSN